MTHDDWRSAVDPKVRGTINLHNALETATLDFFVMFSSQVGLHGWYGQASYAAGNAFQDAFVQYRLDQGLPASVLDIGPIEDIGLMEQHPELRKRMKSTYPYFLGEKELLQALELAIVRSRVQLEAAGKGVSTSSQIVPGLRPSVAAKEGNSNLPWGKDARFLPYRNIEADLASLTSGPSEEQSSTSAVLSNFLASCTRDPSILLDLNSSAVLAQEIFLRVATFLRISHEEQEKLKQALDHISLQDLGIDSLVAIELRAWWKQRLGVEITVLQILDSGTVGKLGDLAVDGLRARFSAPITAS